MKVLRVALAWLFFCAPVFAQVGQIPGWPPIQPATGYVGPGDLATFADWWGFRCYSNAYAGNVADITDAATGNTTGTRLQCTGSSGNGIVSEVVSASACTFVTGNACSPLATTCATACRVKVMYSQAGTTNCTTACNPFQNTNANRPTFTTSCQNGHPCMVTSGSTIIMTSAARSLASQAQPYSGSAVFKSPASGDAFILIEGGTGAQIGYANSLTSVFINSGTSVSVSATANAMHALQGVYSGASCVIYVDSARTSSLNCGTNPMPTAGTYVLGAFNTGAGATSFMEGGFTLSGGSFSNTVQSNLDLNQRAYWGF